MTSKQNRSGIGLSTAPRSHSANAVRVCAMSGLIVPILDIAVISVLGELQPNYSHVNQFISELGETGRPFATVANLWFVLVSTMYAGFAFALLKGTPASKASTTGALLFGAWTTTGIIGGFFPCDAGCAGDTADGAIHVILGEIGTFCLLPVPALIWLGIRGDPRWTRYGWFMIAIQGFALLSFLLLGAVYFGISPLDRLLETAIGLIQRFTLGVYYLWTAVIGLKIARMTNDSTNDVTSKQTPPVDTSENPSAAEFKIRPYANEEFIRGAKEWRFQNLPSPLPSQLQRIVELAAPECFRPSQPFLTTSRLLLGLMRSIHAREVFGQDNLNLIRPGRIAIERLRSREGHSPEVHWIHTSDAVIELSDASCKCLMTAGAQIHDTTEQASAERLLLNIIITDSDCDGHAIWKRCGWQAPGLNR